MATSVVSNEQLKALRDELAKQGKIKAWQIKDMIAVKYGVTLDESIIRGRFIEMGEPLSGGGGPKPAKAATKVSTTQRADFKQTVAHKEHDIPDDMRKYIPDANEFAGYIERDVDTRLAVHYNLGKYPITQGKQGTGKTFGHMYYAHKAQLPFLLFSGYEDFKLTKLFGDKTIIKGSIVFQESIFVKAIQCPSVILFDEINAVSNANTFDFHALLQNRELFIKDADDGRGRVYNLHPECRIGFAQNPKSAKYIGGCIKPSNFLGRCTYITYPEFTKNQIEKAIKLRYPKMDEVEILKFSTYYFAVLQTIERASLPVDVSIRQLNNLIDMWMAGMPLKNAIEDAVSSILDAVSQPKAKDSFNKLAEAIWQELMKKK